MFAATKSDISDEPLGQFAAMFGGSTYHTVRQLVSKLKYDYFQGDFCSYIDCKYSIVTT